MDSVKSEIFTKMWSAFDNYSTLNFENTELVSEGFASDKRNDKGKLRNLNLRNDKKITD